MSVRHFLQLGSCSLNELQTIIKNAISTKQAKEYKTLAKGKTLAMIFEKSSTRTRVAFEVGFSQLGGHALFLDSASLQLGRGEPIPDTSRVISSMVDMIMIRTFEHKKILSFAENSSVPVINGLTYSHHPCQLLADIMTFAEIRGDIAGANVTFVGDCKNNMCYSYMEAAEIFGFNLTLAAPNGYTPEINNPKIKHTTSIKEAVTNADLIVTDVWASMGDEDNKEQRIKDFQGYQITSKVLDMANNPLFLHCLPAHRGEEVDNTVLDDSRSAVWQASENRLHSQKALMEFLFHVN